MSNSNCADFQHYRSTKPTPTESAIWERRQRFRNSLSARAVKDVGIDLKRAKKPVPPMPLAKKMELPPSVTLAPTDGNFITKLVADFSDLMSPPSPPTNDRGYTVREIQDAVCKAAEITYIGMISTRRDRELSVPRQLAMAICKELTTRNFPELGLLFKRDHTTVLHAVRKMKPIINELKTLLDETPLDQIAFLGVNRCKKLFLRNVP